MSSRRTSCLGALLLALVGSTGALAQAPPPVSPPVAQGSTDVPYPADAKGDAVVLLEVMVERDGMVSSAVVTDGAAPFAEQARRAVLGWRFAPALRGGAPVAARIRARVEFHRDETPGVVAAPPAARPAPPLVVTVRGDRREVGQTTISAADVRELPGAFGDPFRAVEALPGVVPIVSGLPYFYIRGAPANDNGYFIDGIRVPQLFHVGIGEGVIHPGLVERVDLHPGAAPASLGGVAGAIVAGKTREPAAAPHGEANLRLLDVGGLVESPLDHGRGSLLVAGRYGYPGPLLGALDSDFKLGYWDYQGRATWRVSDRGTLGIFAFGSHDHLATKVDPPRSEGPAAQSRMVDQLVSDVHRVDLRYDQALDGGRLRIAVTGGYDSQGGAAGDDNPVPVTITDASLAARLEVDRALSPGLRIRGGASVKLEVYTFAESDPNAGEPSVPSAANPPPRDLTGGAHADVVWRPIPAVEIVPGARFDVYQSSRADATTRETTTVPAFDPRLFARVAITPVVAALSAVGLAHQLPALRVSNTPAPLLTVPGFPLGERQLQTALQASQGIEVALPAQVTVGVTGFLSRWWGLTDLTDRCIQKMPGTETGPPMVHPYECPGNHPVRGLAYGVELLARRPLSRQLGGWLSYTLSRSTREAHFVTLSGADAISTVPSDGDRTHVLNAILAYDLGRRWRAGGRFVLFSGPPYSAQDGNIPVPPYNSLRLPTFTRVDVRLEKRWSLGKTGWIAFVVEGQNVTLSKEHTQVATDCTGMPQMLTCKPGTVGPITLPSIGVEASF